MHSGSGKEVTLVAVEYRAEGIELPHLIEMLKVAVVPKIGVSFFLGGRGMTREVA
jgi:hypothetical protein